MRISAKSDSLRRLADEGDGHFVNALLAWGTTRALKEHISLFEYQNARTLSSEFLVQFATESLNLRFEQTAVPYLNLSAITSSPVVPSEPQQQSIKREVQDKEDSLYDIDELISFVSQRATSIDFDKLHRKGHVQIDYTGIRNGRVALDSLARLLMMGNFYDDALKCFLVLGATHATQTLDEIENEAISAINDTATAQPKQIFPFCFVLHLIENFHLHECLFDTSFFPSNVNCSQVCALVRLVGLQLAGEFLIENCVAPQKMSGTSSTDNSSGRQESSQHAVSVKERRGTLPLDMVAEQLSGSPKLLHWYLHLVFSRKPELYVKFPTTANPPSVITNLHKKHLDLYIKYTGKNRDSSQALAGVEAYRVVEHTTPLLAFLKVVLQIGAIGPAEVGKILEKERRGSAGVSRILALELAYMMENFGDGSESDAQLILELYLKGTQSIMLAVSFTQRAHDYFGKLWETLIEYCLSNSSVAEESTQDKTSLKSGALFGSLLEAAAHCGADLAHLVSQIPPGMQVEGLRPRMVAAVADYRLKVELHSISTDIAIAEKVLLYQEMSRRSHRGMRSDGLLEESVVSVAADSAEIITVGCESPNTRNTDEIVLTVLSPTLRTRYRPSRYHHSFSIAIR